MTKLPPTKVLGTLALLMVLTACTATSGTSIKDRDVFRENRSARLGEEGGERR